MKKANAAQVNPVFRRMQVMPVSIRLALQLGLMVIGEQMRFLQSQGEGKSRQQ